MSRRKPQPVRPFLKWAGNKYRIIEKIRRRLPPGSRLVEPFAGSGAVFLNTRYDSYLLADSNADLILLYRQLQQAGEAFVDCARELFQPQNNGETAYYRFREEFNATGATARRAALFVYLNRHGYNGLCRYNSGGGFNVPFGRYRKPYFPEREMLAFAERAQQAEFVHADFRQVMVSARPGDVIYCDPPYVPLSRTASFTTYSAGGFDLEAQHELAELARDAAERGIPVLISNHNTPFTQQTYNAHGAQLSRFQVQRYISCNGAQRGKARELLALFSGSRSGAPVR